MPALTAVVPSVITPLTAASPPLTLEVTGSGFEATAVAYANHTALATTVIDSSNLVCTLAATVGATTEIGGLAIAVRNSAGYQSRPLAITVGGGSNVGVVEMRPLGAGPGATIDIIVDGGLPFAPLTLAVCQGATTLIPSFPDPLANLVLGLPAALDPMFPLLLLVDGNGVFGPQVAAAFDANGTFTLSGIHLPSPASGVGITTQAFWFDASAPAGFQRSWPRRDTL